MTLIKSKINSLAWLKSAIYVSIMGGGVLSSFTPVLAATLSPGYDTPTYVIFSVNQNPFANGVSRLYYNNPNYNWKGSIDIEQSDELFWDELVIRVYLQHIHSPHQGDSGSGGQLTLGFRAKSSSANNPIYVLYKDVSEHPGRNHYDIADGVLTVNKFDRFIGGIKVGTGIKDWDLVISGEHKVPEPTTMFGTALALGWGGWLKRKNLIKQNKTKLQG